MKLIIGITGASGSLYGKLLLEKLDSLRDQISDCGVIFSENAIPVWEFELGPFDPASLPFKIYDPKDFFAPMASGSAGYDTMIVIRIGAERLKLVIKVLESYPQFRAVVTVENISDTHTGHQFDT